MVSRRAASYRGREGRPRADIAVYGLLVPTFVLLAVFAYYPSLSVVYHSFTDWNGRSQTFIGLDNFAAMAADTVLAQSVAHMVILVAAGLITKLAVPLLVAELIHGIRSRCWRGLYRLLLVAPVAVPHVVILLLWQYIYDPNVGPLAAIAHYFHLSGPLSDLLGDPRTALTALILIGFPWVYPINLLVYLAGLQAIPPQLHEAAALDGASRWQRFVHIDMPMLSGQIKMLSILAVLHGLHNVAPQVILTKGGPAFSTTVPAYQMLGAAFNDLRLGYASAIGVALFAVAIIFTSMHTRLLRSGLEPRE